MCPWEAGSVLCHDRAVEEMPPLVVQGHRPPKLRLARGAAFWFQTGFGEGVGSLAFT